MPSGSDHLSEVVRKGEGMLGQGVLFSSGKAPGWSREKCKEEGAAERSYYRLTAVTHSPSPCIALGGVWGGRGVRDGVKLHLGRRLRWGKVF